MNAEDRARIVLKIISPLLIIVMPLFIYTLWNVPNPEGPKHVSTVVVIFMNFISFGAFVCALGYCLFGLNWIRFFRRK